MTTPATKSTPMIADAEMLAMIADAARHAEIEVRTHRQARGTDEADPGMRDFIATATVYLDLSDLVEDLPAWVMGGSWRTVPERDVLDMLASINPLLAQIALGVEPGDEGLRVRLVQLSGSLLNAYRLEGDLFDALDARSSAHEAMYCAFTDQVWGHMSLREDLHVEGVGSFVTLLTSVSSPDKLNTVWDGLEVALVSQVLQDAAEGTDAVLTWLGLGEPSDAVREFFTELSFDSWAHGLWVADTAAQAFLDPAELL